MLPPFNFRPSPRERAQTPFYFYDEKRLRTLVQSLKKAVGKNPDVLVHYAMKANRHETLLRTLKNQGLGADIVSGGELKRALRVGFKPQRIVFSGVGKTDQELTQALKAGVFMINIESRSEFLRLRKLCAKSRKRARISFRVNPEIAAETHPYIATANAESKFGVSLTQAEALYREAHACPEFQVEGVSFHLGSQLMDLSAVTEAVSRLLPWAEKLKKAGLHLPYLDIGGGVGVDYQKPDVAPDFAAYSKVIFSSLRLWKGLFGAKAKVMVELGRSLVAQAGLLVTRVIALKDAATLGGPTFAIVDAGMNDLIRPALYQAVHPVRLLEREGRPVTAKTLLDQQTYTVAGPICESADVFAVGVRLPKLQEGDLLALECAGAYGQVMSSQYNDRPLTREIWKKC